MLTSCPLNEHKKQSEMVKVHVGQSGGRFVAVWKSIIAFFIAWKEDTSISHIWLEQITCMQAAVAAALLEWSTPSMSYAFCWQERNTLQDHILLWRFFGGKKQGFCRYHE